MNPEHYAIMMMLLFVLVVVAGRVAVQFYLTGDSGIRSGTRLKSTKDILISFLMFGVLGIQLLLTWLYSMSIIEAQVELGAIGSGAGIALCLAGIVFASYAQIVMGKEWRIGVDPDEKSQLVTTGIYGKIRNPIYTGCIIHGAGIVFLAPHAFIFLAGIVGYYAVRAYVKHIEEPYLIALHGDEYRQYMSRTGSFFVKLGRMPNGPAS